jgi:hypothetical protein
VGRQSERERHRPADAFAGGQAELVQGLFLFSFVGTSLLSTHGFLQGLKFLAGWHESPHTLACFEQTMMKTRSLTPKERRDDGLAGRALKAGWLAANEFCSTVQEFKSSKFPSLP